MTDSAQTATLANVQLSNETTERVAVALYRLDHPAYLLHTFEAVPLLDTVLAYRKRAWVALNAAVSDPQRRSGE